MNIEITTANEHLHKGDTALYSLSINPENIVSDIKIEIIPSAEKYPDSNIIPNIDSVTINNELSYTADILDNGIFEIDIPKLNSTGIITISYSAQVSNNFDKNTTAVIVTSDNNGSSYEAYAQTTVDGNSLPAVVPVICIITFTFISAILLWRIIRSFI